MVQEQLVSTITNYYLREQEEIVCSLKVEHYATTDIINIFAVYTDEEHRGKGYATKLMKDVIKRYKSKTMMLGVQIDNNNAITLYEKLGFRYSTDSMESIYNLSKKNMKDMIIMKLMPK